MTDTEEKEILQREWESWRGSKGTVVFRNHIQAELVYLVDKLTTHETLMKPEQELRAMLALAVSYKEQLNYLDNVNILEDIDYDKSTWLSSVGSA